MIVVVCAVVVIEEGKALLIEESKSVAAHKYGLPGGKLEAKETLKQCAQREFKEETGMDVEIRDLVAVTHKPNTRESNSVVKFIFTGDIQRRDAKHAELRSVWFDQDEVDKLSQDGRIRGKDVTWVLSKAFKGDLRSQPIPDTFA